MKEKSRELPPEPEGESPEEQPELEEMYEGEHGDPEYGDVDEATRGGRGGRPLDEDLKE